MQKPTSSTEQSAQNTPEERSLESLKAESRQAHQDIRRIMKERGMKIAPIVG